MVGWETEMGISIWVALAMSLLVGRGFSQETLHVAAFEEVHVTGDCRIYYKNTPEKKPRYFRDAGICRQESENHVMVPETTLANGVVTRVVYEIRESDYLLHNFTDHKVAFVLDQRLPKGWRVVSDPQPISLGDRMAIYRVIAEPGQTVRLHTGQRR